MPFVGVLYFLYFQSKSVWFLQRFGGSAYRCLGIFKRRLRRFRELRRFRANGIGLLTREVIGCAMKVHPLLGCGFLEIVELERKNIVFERQAVLPVRYGDQPIGSFIADYLVGKQLILELKASNGLTPACHSQLLNYLRASNLSLGLLLNFGTPSLQIKRKVNKIRT